MSASPSAPMPPAGSNPPDITVQADARDARRIGRLGKLWLDIMVSRQILTAEKEESLPILRSFLTELMDTVERQEEQIDELERQLGYQ